jgi:hypothetical protein
MVSQDKAFNELKNEIRSGFVGLIDEVRSTNKRLDGIGSYLRSINGNILDHF